VVLAGIPRFRGALPQIALLIWLTDQYARILRRIGRAEAQRAGVRYVDLTRDVPPRVRDLEEILSVDRFHPSRAGYALWADVIGEALADPADSPPPVLSRTGSPAIA
jgi:lysophospholipase L1-like esterase